MDMTLITTSSLHVTFSSRLIRRQGIVVNQTAAGNGFSERIVVASAAALSRIYQPATVAQTYCGLKQRQVQSV